MNNEEAKKILALYRPGMADRNDPDIEEALALAKPFPAGEREPAASSRELAGWFREHCSSHLSIRAKFNKIPVPPTLKDRIMADYKARLKPPPVRIQFRPTLILQAAAVLVLCLGLAAFFWHSQGQEDDFNVYRSRMTRVALQAYGMDLESHDLSGISTYLAAHHAPADYTLPNGVKKAEPVGCAVLKWQGQPVSMICFRSGQPLGAGEKTDLWLFIIDQSSMRNGPVNGNPVIAPIKRLTTATWNVGGKTYILASAGNEDLLRKFF